jgi:hypothetical protein
MPKTARQAIVTMLSRDPDDFSSARQLVSSRFGMILGARQLVSPELFTITVDIGSFGHQNDAKIEGTL